MFEPEQTFWRQCIKTEKSVGPEGETDKGGHRGWKPPIRNRNYALLAEEFQVQLLTPPGGQRKIPY